MRNRKHILWLSANSYPQIGGLQTYNTQMMKMLSRYYRVTFVTDEKLSLPDCSGINIVNISGLGGCRKYKKNKEIFSTLKLIIKNINPDLIHLGDAGMCVYTNIIPKNIPLMVTVHGNDLTSPWQASPEKDIISQLVNGLNFCTQIIAVSKHTQELISKYNVNAPISIITPGCDVKSWSMSNSFERETLKERYKIPTDVPIILTTGRLAERKGHLLILEALSCIKVPFHWVILGQGKTSPWIKLKLFTKKMRSKVSMLGWVALNELRIFYNMCDFFILTPIERYRGKKIDSEGFGLVFYEAAACSKAVIGTRISGCQEAILNNETGLLVEPGSVLQIREAILKLLSNKELSKELGRQAYEHVVKNGSWEKVAEKVKNLYEAVFLKQEMDICQ